MHMQALHDSRNAFCSLAILAAVHASARADEPTCPGGTPITIFADDFETDQGWSSTFDGGASTTGQWVRVDPIGTTAQPEDDHSEGGTQCFVTGNGEGTPPTFDVDGGPVYLTSPALNLPADAVISFWYWFHWGGNGAADALTVQVSNNGGAAWTMARVIACPPTGCTTEWQCDSFRLADFVIPTANVRVRFVTSDLPNDSLTEAAIDDVLITHCGLLGDFDFDGDVDLTDYHSFALCMRGPASGLTQSCENRDLDADADADLRDFLTFQDNFTSP